MNSDSMDEDLVEELDYVKELLIKSGFFSTEDMLEILKDQFIDEDIDFSKAASEIVPCEYNGERITIGFKGSILLQMLTNISGEKVNLLLSDPSRAGIITEGDENSFGYDYISLIMPMLIS